MKHTKFYGKELCEMSHAMTYKSIVTKYPNKLVLAMVDRRHPDSGRAVLFKVLRVFRNERELRKAYEYYNAEGFEEILPINSYLVNDPNALEMSPDLTAAFFRKYFNT